MKKGKAIIFAPINMTFVRRDKAMLEERFAQVDVQILPTGGGLQVGLSILKSFWWSLIRVRSYELVACWFVGYHSLFPLWFARLYGKRSVAFLGGTECHNYPEIDHGNFRKPVYAWFTRASLRLARFILPVHETLIHSEETYIPLKFPQQGIRAFCPGIKGKVEALHCGFELQKPVDWSAKKKASFLSVSSLLYGKTYVRKGVDMVVELARRCPEYQFTLVGAGYQGPDLPNLEVIGAISYQELIDIYIGHQFYLQLSVAEGFPNALAEAMLYGCIPIGSSVFGIPDMVRETGYILNQKDLDQAESLLRQAVKEHPEIGDEMARSASERVHKMYTFEARSNRFREIVEI